MVDRNVHGTGAAYSIMEYGMVKIRYGMDACTVHGNCAAFSIMEYGTVKYGMAW